ncbi:MAG: UDP-N-acetylmuramoyl-tripeptide--D-alanyl-D-alanine ligase [Ignavibacteria bacterium]|nr:UDP-N-acetylmuramoyl-tripeptide--D-alanyl-D-alanine ligase [Ignavibacteria bacterium]
MTNVATFTHQDLLAIFGNAASHLPSTLKVTSISTDTRTLVPGNAFVALRGERFDGHNNVQEALQKGASLIVVEESSGLASNDVTLVVASTLNALGSFGWYHRRRFTIPVIAIAGAAGKTSTKDLTAHVLSQDMRVLKTQANYNNQVGTPLTLLQLTDDVDAAVIEIGTNEPGEIEILSAMVQPTHGLITNIGKEHLEKLIDLDGVEREETALFDYLRDHGGLAFVNNDDPRLSKYATSFTRAITFGVENTADIHLTVGFDIDVRPSVHIVHGTFAFRAQLQTHGLASAYNAACAVAIGWSMQMHPEFVQRGLNTYVNPSSAGYGRMRVERINNLTVLNDTYNANPESVLMALRTLQRYPASKRIAILGDMRELGVSAEEEHMHIISASQEYADVVIVIGDEFRRAAERLDAPHLIVTPTHRGCVEHLLEVARDNSVVLVKGSRGMAMERVLDLLQGA